MKNISFLSEIFQFLEVKFSIYLYRRVFAVFTVTGYQNFVLSRNIKNISFLSEIFQFFFLGEILYIFE